MTTRTGVLLLNTGTPRSPQVRDVRRYLAQFLDDPRVIDIHPVARWLLLHAVILPFRPAKSAAAYRKIWTPQGSPLLVHGNGLVQVLQGQLGPDADVRLGMQFGEPSIPDAMAGFVRDGVDRVVVVPLFPQYAAASTGSATQAAMEAAGQHWTVPALQVVPPFWQAPEFLDLLADRLREAVEREGPDHVLFSYHGVPERHCQRTDRTGAHCLKATTCCDAIGDANRHCYRAQCFATTRELVARLGLGPQGYSVGFQSRLGRTPWIRPYTDHLLTELAQRGVKKLLVAEPSFVADCLETVEEIGIRGREDFRAAGGGDLALVPSLNAGEDWGRALAAILRRSCAWLQGQPAEIASASPSTARTSASGT